MNKRVQTRAPNRNGPVDIKAAAIELAARAKAGGSKRGELRRRWVDMVNEAVRKGVAPDQIVAMHHDHIGAPARAAADRIEKGNATATANGLVSTPGTMPAKYVPTQCK